MWRPTAGRASRLGRLACTRPLADGNLPPRPCPRWTLPLRGIGAQALSALAGDR
jgi:hypothetical protein